MSYIFENIFLFFFLTTLHSFAHRGSCLLILLFFFSSPDISWINYHVIHHQCFVCIPMQKLVIYLQHRQIYLQRSWFLKKVVVRVVFRLVCWVRDDENRTGIKIWLSLSLSSLSLSSLSLFPLSLSSLSLFPLSPFPLSLSLLSLSLSSLSLSPLSSLPRFPQVAARLMPVVVVVTVWNLLLITCWGKCLKHLTKLKYVYVLMTWWRNHMHPTFSSCSKKFVEWID